MKALLALASITLLSACAATRPIETHAASAATDFPYAQRVAITLSYFRFTPLAIDLVAGEPHVLMLKDSGAGGHDFTAAEFLAAAAIAPADASQVAGRRIELVGHQTASIHVIPTTASTGRHVPISAMRRWA